MLSTSTILIFHLHYSFTSVFLIEMRPMFHLISFYTKYSMHIIID
nr:MAG TPA: hypothetical protein [Caudoviricetes sp.]